MSVLLIDAGNTRVKFSCLHDKQTKAQAELILLHSELDQLKGYFKDLPLSHAIGVNVAGGQLAGQIKKALPTSCQLQWLNSKAQLLHLKNSYKEVEQLGADRFLALLGLKSVELDSQQVSILATLGTATTVDTVVQDTFVGGMILPGISLMVDSLSKGTAQLPHIPQRHTLPSSFGRSTLEAIESGILGAQVGAIMRQWHRAIETYKCQPHIYLSGGAYSLVIPELEYTLRRAVQQQGFDTMLLSVFENPVLEGLRLIATRYFD